MIEGDRTQDGQGAHELGSDSSPSCSRTYSDPPAVIFPEVEASFGQGMNLSLREESAVGLHGGGMVC